MLIKAQTLGKGWKGGSHTEDTQTHQWNVCLECVCEIVLCCQPFCGSSEKEPQRMLLLVCRCCRCCFCLQINLITWIMPLKIIHKNPKSRGILANGSTAAAETTKKFNYWVQPSTQTGSKRTLPYTVNYRRSMIPVKSAPPPHKPTTHLKYGRGKKDRQQDEHHSRKDNLQIEFGHRLDFPGYQRASCRGKYIL